MRRRLVVDRQNAALVGDGLIRRRGGVDLGNVVGQAGTSFGLAAGVQRAFRASSTTALVGVVSRSKARGTNGASVVVLVPSLQNMLSARRASSLMRVGSQGGSQTTSTRTSRTPFTARTASSTWPGSSCAEGQEGVVRVI